MVLYLLTLLGVAFFAVSGALRAGEKEMDFFGVVVIAAITATGGGTIRDVLLGTQPVFWIEDINFLLVSAAAATTTVLYIRLREPPINSLLVTDAFGLAVATVIGAQAAAEAGASPLIVVVMGVTTGVAGGILRDVLCAEVPLILKK
ncbi:MAG TPA: TRIC cation channel family protein, partial [Rubrobacteraceae bacterium]|nr:TRIC cation channel family protein [Rubrobacteraceae bacterium]